MTILKTPCPPYLRHISATLAALLGLFLFAVLAGSVAQSARGYRVATVIEAVSGVSAAEARPRRGFKRHARYHRKAFRKTAVRPAMAVSSPSPFSWGGGIVEAARREIGKGAVYGRATLWCARFMNHVLKATGHQGTGSDLARSFASYGRRVGGPQVGAIAVLSRGRGGGHVGVVSGVDRSGNPIIISGNHNRRVAESTYSARRVVAYVMPN